MFKLVDEFNTVETGIETLAEAIELAKENCADVFEDKDCGDCVWTNPELEIQ